MTREQNIDIAFSALVSIARNPEGDWTKVGKVGSEAHPDTIRRVLQDMEDLGWVERRTDGGKHYYATEQTYLLASSLHNPELDVFN